MKNRYEYDVVGMAADGYPVYGSAYNRQNARDIKKQLKDYGCNDVKIIQNKYELKTSREVR